MIPGLRARLGEATERLYLRLLGIADQAEAEGEAKRALCRIALDAACGAYHDFRSFRAAPKGALVDELHAVPGAAATEQIASVVKEIIAGWYDDGDEEARRWVRDLAPERQHARGGQQAAAPRLSDGDRRVLEIVRRKYAEERRLVTCTEIGEATGANMINTDSVLKRLVKKGAVIYMGKGAGYLPAYEAT